MKINQLFKTNVPEDLFIKIYTCFGIKSLESEYTFTKLDLIKLNTVENLNELIEELESFYLPCKAKVYLDDLNVNKSITVLRQILRLYNMLLNSKQKYIKHKKTTIYYVTKYVDNVSEHNSLKVDNLVVKLNFN